MKFTWTDFYSELDSSVIEGIYYNSNSKECAVDVKGQIYKYKEVIPEDVKEFIDASSVGKHYQEFMREFGPGEFLGEWSKVDFVREEPDAVESPSDGFTLSSTGLYADKIKSSTSDFGTIKSSLAASYIGTKYDVVFVVVENGSEEKVFQTWQPSAERAIGELQEKAKVFGINLRIKKVVMYFE